MQPKKKPSRTHGAFSDKPKPSEHEQELINHEEQPTDATARVIAWPIEGKPTFLAWARVAPRRYWTAVLEYDHRLPDPLPDAALPQVSHAYRQAEQFTLAGPNDYQAPNGWRHATRAERVEGVQLAYECQRRQHAAKTGRILPPITKDRERIARREREKARITAAVNGETQVPEGSRLERIVAAHRLYASTRGLVDIREEIARREMPDDDEQEAKD